MFSDEQIKCVGKYLKDKFLYGSVEPTEIVVALISMVKAKKLLEDHVALILIEIYDNNVSAAHIALEKASKILSDDMVDDILKSLLSK